MARTEDSALANQAAQSQLADTGGDVDPVDMALPEPLVAVPVRTESPALGVGRTVGLNANRPVLPLLPQDPRRRRAVVQAVEKAAVICQSVDLATFANSQANTGSIEGYYLPSGGQLTLTAKCAWWVTYTTTDAPGAGATNHVSVLVEKDDD